MPSSRRSAIDAAPCRFDSFAPSGPRIRPWWRYSGGSAPSALAIASWSGVVRKVILAADHVRDSEIDVVDHGREVIGRPAVRAKERRPALFAEAKRPRVLEGCPGRRELLRGSSIELAALALPQGALVPLDAEPFEVAQYALLRVPFDAFGIGVVDSQHENAAGRPRSGGLRRL